MYSAIIFLKLKADYTILRYMQTRLSGIATLLTTAEKLHFIASNNDVAKNGLFMQHTGVEHLEQQKQKLEQLKTLVGYLEAKTFSGDYSFFSDSGRILAAFHLIQELKNEFVGLMQAVGEVDACLSIAKLYKSLQSSTLKNENVSGCMNNYNATYCFVEYIEKDTPYLHLEDFWNPIINPQIVVTNSLELGDAQSPRNIVVTGSNTGGKSTILKSIVVNIMLSRLGIAPARKAVMTPFTYVATSMNIGDDTAGGISLFKAEVLRAKSILDNVRSLQPHQHAFLAIDELFVGTASEKGEEAACKFAQALNALPNTMFTFATHFKKATELEQKTNGSCKNYMVEAFKDENGNIVRPFKLEPGISTSNIANDILQENISSIDFLESTVDVLA
jgi:DNA mismatch repair ATPase MutS